MKSTDPKYPKFMSSNDSSYYAYQKIVSTCIEGVIYTFYKGNDGNTYLMKRDTFFQYIESGNVPLSGKPEDILGPNAGKYL